MSAGAISSAPHAPRPPAFTTAIDSFGAATPAIGASRIGIRIPNRSQNWRVRSAIDTGPEFAIASLVSCTVSITKVAAMNDVILKRFEQPDETRMFELGRFDLVTLAGTTI